MNVLSLPVLATAVGFPWVNLLWTILGIMVFVCLVAAMGRYLAATHPSSPPVADKLLYPAATIPTDVEVVIAAAVYAALGETAQVTSVIPVEQLTVNVDKLMQVWSLEGRREIYSSHRVR